MTIRESHNDQMVRYQMQSPLRVVSPDYSQTYRIANHGFVARRPDSILIIKVNLNSRDARSDGRQGIVPQMLPLFRWIPKPGSYKGVRDALPLRDLRHALCSVKLRHPMSNEDRLIGDPKFILQHERVCPRIVFCSHCSVLKEYVQGNTHMRSSLPRILLS
jgi:hypothetical protein